MIRRKTAREVLAESFRELAAQAPVDRITVKAIAQNCGYSQATFYRQFRDKYDLITWDYSQRIGRIMDRVGEDGYTWRQMLADGADWFGRERDYLANLFRHTSGYDSFVRYMTEINYEALKKQLLKAGGRDELDEKLDMCARTYVYGTVSLTCEWVLGRYSASPGELAEVFELSLPLPLQPCLL